MKKILSLVLAIAMILTFVPVAFAAPAEKSKLDTNEFTMDRAYEQKAVNANGEMVTSSSRAAAKSTTLEGINEKYTSMSVKKTGEVATKALFEDVGLTGVEEIPVEEASSTGYWFENGEDGQLVEITDWYTTETKPVYCQRFTTVEGELIKAYAKGETVFINYDLYNSFDATTGEFAQIPELEDGNYNISMNVLGGALQDDGETISFNIIGSWSSVSSEECGISVKYTAPEDEYYFMFIVAIDKVDAIETCGAWLAVSSVLKDSEFKAVPQGDALEVGKTVSTDLGKNGTQLVVAPQFSMYSATYAQAHKVTLEGGKRYVVEMNSADQIGGHIWFCDAEMNIINESFMYGELIQSGEYDYTDVSMAVWPTESGVYYIVVGGYWMTDEGVMDVTLMNWEDCSYAVEMNDVNVAINFDDLGTEDYVAEDKSWGYHWFSEDSVGMLILAYPGTYTLTGDGSDTFLTVYDAVNVVYNNASSAAVQLKNEMAPVSIEAKGTATIADNDLWAYAIYNISPECRGGLYLVGDQFSISGMFGIVLESAAVTLAAKKIVVDTTSAEGYYPIAIWVLGLNMPTITLGKNAQFSDSYKVAELFYDANSVFHYGYTVSAQAELSRQGSPNWEEGALSFVLTTEGLNEGGAGMLGDANLDGKLNTGDAVTVLKHAANIIALEGEALANADMNGDGKVNTGDAVAILKWCASN